MGTVIVNRALEASAISPSMNLVANGGFEQWSYGTLFTSPANFAPLADGWQIQFNGAPTFVVSRESGAGNFDTGLYSAKLNVTALGGSGYIQIAQVIPNYQEYRGKNISVSVRVKANAAADVWITDGVSGTGSTPHTGDGTWQTLTATDNIASNATTVQIWLRLQSTGIAYFDSVMLSVGTQALAYVPDNVEISKVKAGGMSAVQANLPNLLDNGGFGAGQKYSGIQFNPTANTVVIDRWKTLYATSGVQPTFSYQRVADGNQAHAIRFNCSVVGTGSVTDGRFAYQVLDPDIDVFALRGQQISLSMWIKSNTNQAGLQLQYGSGLFGYAYHSGGGAWEYLTCTVTVDAAATILTVGAFAPNATCDIWINNAMLVVGGVPMPYVQTPPALEMMRCQRYYEKNDSALDSLLPMLRNASINQFVYTPIRFSVYKSAVPSVTVTKTSMYMYHLPTTGNGNSGNDMANWTLTAGGSIGKDQFVPAGQRSTDQTTYPVMDAQFTWVAEVT